MTTAGNGADSAGQGAVQIRFVDARRAPTTCTRQRLLLPAARRAQREHLVQQPRPAADPATGKAPKTELRQYQPGFASAADRDSRPLRRPQQGVLLRQLRRAPARRAQCTLQPHDPHAGGAAGHLPLQRGGATATVEPAAARRRATARLATLDPTVAQAARATSAVRDDERRASPTCSDPLAAAVRRSRVPIDELHAVPTVRLDYNLTQNAPADRVVQLSAHQLDARTRPTTAQPSLPRLPDLPAASSPTRYTTCGIAAVDVRRRTSSTSSASAAPAARRCSRRR